MVTINVETEISEEVRCLCGVLFDNTHFQVLYFLLTTGRLQEMSMHMLGGYAGGRLVVIEIKTENAGEITVSCAYTLDKITL